MTSIPDGELFQHAERVKDKVVIITGSAAGIGKASAMQFAKHEAKVIVADRDFVEAERTASEITSSGGQALPFKCDVTIWEDLVAMYEFALENYQAVDIVVANAGVGEVEGLINNRTGSDKQVAPPMTTVNVNLIGVLNTVHLAQYYLLINRRDPNSLKAVVLLGSIASWAALGAAIYTATKYALLGLMRSVDLTFAEKGIRITTIHPFFADTAIVPTRARIMLAGVSLAPVHRITGAIFYSASHPDPGTSGSSFIIPDGDAGPVLMLTRIDFKAGVYDVIDERSNAKNRVTGVVYCLRTMQDLTRMFWRPIVTTGVGVAIALTAFRLRSK